MDVSARPENLKHFVTEGRAITTRFKSAIKTAQTAYTTFTSAPNDYPVTNGSLMDNGGGLDALASTWTADELFVELVQQAFEDADEAEEPGIVTADGADIERAVQRKAEQAGAVNVLDADRPELSITDPQVAPVPRTSGFVRDPVCTATGHFVEDEVDLVWPPRLRSLAWRRVYSSQPGRTGPHGRGWGAWASVAIEHHPDGHVTFRGADGQTVRFEADDAGRWRRNRWIPASLTVEDADQLAVQWDWASDHPAQRWTFDDRGRLDTVHGPDAGVTTFNYEGRRLVALTHDSGRRLDVVWDDVPGHDGRAHERVVALRSSCGRTVRYRYDERGDLVMVERPSGAMRYLPDEAGRIVEGRDADDVRLFHNTFDAEGRVLRQVSPFGRETVFSYQRGRVTLVSDTDSGPVSVWQHDDAGRLVSLTNTHGHRLARRFDEEGRCEGIVDVDGRSVANELDAGGRVVAMRTSEGAEERFEHDDLDRVRQYVRADGSSMVFEYEGDSPYPSKLSGPDGWTLSYDVQDGLVRRVTDADGVTVSAEYDSDGNVVAMVDGLGHRTSIRPHVSGQASEVELPDGARFSFDHDGAGRLLAVRAPTGETWRLEWTPAGRPARLIGPDGHVTLAVEYASHGAEEQVTDALGRCFRLEHDALERVRALVTADGRKWEFAYSAMGLVAAVQDPAGATVQFEHDRRGRLLARTDPLGHSKRYRYDPIGRLAELTDPTGATTTIARDAVGRVEAVVDAEGAVTRYGYDGCGRLVSVDEPDGGTLQHRYSPAGRLLEVRSAEGRGEVFEYDAAGRLVATTDATGGRTALGYDACGRLAEIIRPSGRWRRFERDALGRVVTVDEGGFVWRFTHDHDGRVTSRTDPLGATTRYRYDAAGHLVGVVDPLGGTTTLEWDERNVCTRVTDALGLSVTTLYDERRRAVAFTDQLGRTTRLRRDGAGRIVGRDLPTGQRVDYVLDAASRVTDVRVNGRDVIVRQFDRCGRPLVVHEPGPNRTHVLTWSRGGRLRAISTGDATMSWQLDRDGLVVERTAAGRCTRYRRDGAGRLVGQSGAGYGDLRLERDPDGRLVALHGDGIERRFGYDATGALVRQIARTGRSLTASSIERDGAGRVVGVRTGTERRRYRYDAGGQLVGAEGPDGLWSFTYDAVGRLVHEDGPSGPRTFLYDDAHELVRVESDAGTVSYGYDAAGQRTSMRASDGRVVSYRWDGLGRLVGIDTPDARTDLDVDAFGSLVGVNAASVQWDPTTPVPELLAYGDQEVVVCDSLVLGEGEGEAAAWRTTDWRGTSGAADPWGASASADAGASLRLGFGGELEVAGLVWLRHRAYDPGTRQFVSQDPLPGRPGLPFTLNPYHYAGNDPVGHIDPLGLEPVSFEEYDRVRDAATGIQWKNVAMIAGAVVMTALAVSGVGLPILLAAGFVAGAAPELIGQIEQGNGIQLDQILKAGAFGMAGAGFGAAASRILPVAGQSLLRGVTQGATANAIPSAAEETYDHFGLPGGDGTFDIENVLVNTVVGGIGGSVEVRRPVGGPPGGDPPSGDPTPNGNADPAPSGTADPAGPGAQPGPTPAGQPPTPVAEPAPVGGRPPFTRPERVDAINDRVSEIQAGGGSSIVTGSRQVDASGNPLGLNRPHLQYTDSQGVRHVEFFTEPGEPASSLADRVARVQAQDPDAVVVVHQVPAGAPVGAGAPGP